MLLLLRPPAVTRTGPVVTPVGTEAVMLVSLQLITFAATPLKVTVPVSWVDPKVFPAIVTTVPAFPLVGETLVIVGEGMTVNETVALLAAPFVVTTTAPVVANLGTVTTICVSLQLVTATDTPLKAAVLVP